MAYTKKIFIKQSLNELKQIHKKVIPFLQPRINMLILTKQNEESGISKRALAELLHVSTTSIQAWRDLYEIHGIEGLCSHNKIGFKPSLITDAEKQHIGKKLNDPQNGIRGYKELKIWVEEEFGKSIKYNTLLKFSVRNFKSKSKVAVKSHVNKDKEAVKTFKKTSLKNVMK